MFVSTRVLFAAAMYSIIFFTWQVGRTKIVKPLPAFLGILYVQIDFVEWRISAGNRPGQDDDTWHGADCTKKGHEQPASWERLLCQRPCHEQRYAGSHVIDRRTHMR